MGDRLTEGVEVVAISNVHVPFTDHHKDITKCMSIIKGEVLRIVHVIDDMRVLVENKHGLQGHVMKSSIYPTDIYHNEDFYLCDFTATMAERILSQKPPGTFMVRCNSRDPEKLVISAVFDTVKHYSFQKKEGGIDYNGVHYKSIPSFVNKCSCDKVLEGRLSQWIKQSDINVPQMSDNGVVTKMVMNLRVVAGNLAVAVEEFNSLTTLCLEVVKGKLYQVLRSSRNASWFIARDDQGKEGYVPSFALECYIPQWFHGRIDRDEAERRLRRNMRDGTFLVKERLSKLGTYALSVWVPDGNIVHVPLAYVNGKITTGPNADLPKFDCMKDLVDHYMKETSFWTVQGECIRILFPLSRKESQVPDEIRTMDMQSVDMYFNALKEGREHVRDIRLMVIGHHGAGKTTLTERLMGKPFTQVGSTNGIEIHLRQCQYNVKTEVWQNNRPGSAYLDDEETHRLRILRVLESPTEDRVSVLEDLRNNTASPINMLMYNSKTSLRESSPALSRTSSDMSLTHNDSSTMMNESVSSKDMCFSYADLEEQNYRIDVDNSDISRYNFSDGTLKVIESTFGRRRQESGNGNEKIGFISMWDFAGQFIFYATHQVFLTPRAVYILCLDLSKKLDDFVVDEEFPVECDEMQGRLVKDYCDFWLRSIHTFGGEVPGHPPVVLVGTHRNKMDCKPEEQEAYAEHYFEEFRKLVENSPVAAHLQPEQFMIDNTLDDVEFEKLKKVIVQVAKRQKHWNQEIPARWLLLERALSKLRQTQKSMSLEEVFQADSQNEVGIKDREEILLFLRFQHAVGSLMYFDDLHSSIILDPQWIIDAFKSLITARKFCSVRPQLRLLWSLLQEQAILKDQLINEIWKETTGGFLENRDVLLAYMEKLDIIARPKIQADGHEIKTDYYFVPSLLRRKSDKTALVQPGSGTNVTTPNLCFVFKEGFIPPMVFQRMLGACLARYSLLTVGKDVQLYCDLGVFQLDSVHCFTFWFDENLMKVKVMNVVGNKVRAALCDKLRRFLSSQLDSELCRYQQNTSFTVCIECLKPDRTADQLLNCKELLKNEKLPCYAHNQPHTVQASIILQSWYPDYIDVPQGQSTQHNWLDNLPSVIRKREVTLKDLSKFAQSLGFNWEFVPIELGLTQPEIEQVKLDYKDQTAMQIYYSLLKWKNRCGHEANIETLVKAIQQNKVVDADWETIKNVVDRI